MKRRASPTQLTLKALRDRGIAAEVVEKWVKFGPFGGVRRDCFGADLQCITKEHTFGIQAGMVGSIREKERKAMALPIVRAWLSSPSRRFLVWTWGKKRAQKKNGTKSKREVWVERITELCLVGGVIECRPFTLAPVPPRNANGPKNSAAHGQP